MSSQPIQLLAIMSAIIGMAPPLNAGIVDYHDFRTWQDAVADFETINFIGTSKGEVAYGQYIDRGVLFTDQNDFFDDSNSYLNDGEGIKNGSDGFLTIEFVNPIHWFGAENPGGLRIEIFLGREQIGQVDGGGGGEGFFEGFTSNIPFDRVVLSDPSDSAAYIDDIHFQSPIPAAPAFVMIGLAACAPGFTRRRSG